MVVSVGGAMHDSSEMHASTGDVASVALRDVEFCVLDLETTGGRVSSKRLPKLAR